MQTAQEKRQAKNRAKGRAMARKAKHRAQWAPLLARDSTPARDKRKGR